MTVVDPELVGLQAALTSQSTDPLAWWKLGLKHQAADRLRTAFNLFTADNPITELHLRACNKGTKTHTKAAFVVACLQKRAELDGIRIPQWRGRVEGLQLVRDYPQQLLSVKPAYKRVLAGWPHRITKDGDYIKSIHIMPVHGDPTDESDWSVIYFLSQKNYIAGTGARADIIDFDEPPVMDVLDELRKAAHAGRTCMTIIGETPTKRREWAPLREDYGDCPRSSLKRVDEDRAECRWSLHEVADWLIPPEEKERLRRQYKRSAIADAREHGDYTNAEGDCPFDAETIVKMISAWCRPPRIEQFRVPIQGPDGKPHPVVVVPVQVWEDAEAGALYYQDIDPASGVDDNRHHKAGLHQSKRGSGDLVARWAGHIAPWSLGVLGAGIGVQYNQSAIDIEMKDHWGVNVFKGLQDADYPNVCHEQRELRPGVFSPEVGFDANEEARAVWIGGVQQWIAAFAAGVPYAVCPSREVFDCLLDCELDDRGKIIAGPGLEHGLDLVLLGQKLRRAVTRSRTVFAPKPVPQTVNERLIARMRGELHSNKPGMGQPLLKPRFRR